MTSNTDATLVGGVVQQNHPLTYAPNIANDALAKWTPFFGAPNGPVTTSAYDKYNNETYDLPEAYRGKNLFLRDTLEGFIIGEKREWYTTVALPWSQTDQIHIVWNEFKFDQTLAARVPHEGISRLVTSSKRQFRDHTLRRGLAMMLEHGFMSTPEGQRQYALNIQGIKQCVQETCNYDVIFAYLTCQNYLRNWERQHGMLNVPLKELMRREVNMYAIVQKNTDGLAIFFEDCKMLMARYGVVPDLFIFPPKMSMYLQMVDPKKTQFLAAGPQGNMMLKEGPDALTEYRGAQVHETRSFNVQEGELPVDLLRRSQQCGEFYTMFPERYWSERPGVNYNTKRDIHIYDEEQDDWARISFADALAASRRFHGDTYSTEFTTFAKAQETTELQASPDMFLYIPKTPAPATFNALHALDHPPGIPTGAPPSCCQTVTYFGQMEKSMLDDHTVLEVVKSLASCPQFDTKALMLGSVETGTQLLTNFIKGIQRAKVDGFDVGLGDGTVTFTASVVRDTLGSLFVQLNAEMLESRDAYARMQSMFNNDCTFMETGTEGPGCADTSIEMDIVTALGMLCALAVNEMDEKMVRKIIDERYKTKAAYAGSANITTGQIRVPSGWGLRLASYSLTQEDIAANIPRGEMRVLFDQVRKTDKTGGAATPSMCRVTFATQDPMRNIFLDMSTNADAWTQKDHGSQINQRLSLLTTDINLMHDKQMRFAYKMFLSLKVTQKSLLRLLQLGVHVPVGVLLMRPYIEHEMYSAILTKGGLETGASFFGHSDFQLGDDVTTKMHYGNFTFYSKAIVQRPKNVMIAENVMAAGYVGGDNTEFFKSKTDLSQRMESRSVAGAAVRMPSLFAFMVPANQKTQNPLSVTGTPSNGVFMNPELEMTTGYDPITGHYNGNPHFSSSAFYNSVWAFSKYHKSADSPEEADAYMKSRISANVMCFQGHQWNYDKTEVKVNTGHWGPEVGPGVADVRAGVMKQMPNFGWANRVVGSANDKFVALADAMRQ